MDKVKVTRENGQTADCFIILVDECPYCHKNIHPNWIYGISNASNMLQLVHRCTNVQCGMLFIGYFNWDGNRYILSRVSIGRKKRIEISEIIKKISEDFTNIYTESNIAEQDNLFEICGAGYRKALEFLIKDYLIYLEPDNEDKINNAFLGNCIKNFIKNENIKAVAKRAAWLGNDEVHYVRKWEGDNLKNLKKLIELTMDWIKMEELTKEIQEDMPEEIKAKIEPGIIQSSDKE